MNAFHGLISARYLIMYINLSLWVILLKSMGLLVLELHKCVSTLLNQGLWYLKPSLHPYTAAEMLFLRPTSLLCHLLQHERKGGGRKPMNNGVIILSYCEIDELHLLFLPLKPWLTRCSSAPCTADLSIPHAAGRRIQRALEPGHYRAHSACSNAEARSSSKWYGEFSVADQSCEKLLFFFFFWFCFFFFLL